MTGGKPEALHGAVQKLLVEIIKEAESVIFNGDGYSAAWHQEAAKRGLLNLKSSIDALPMLADPAIKALFSKYGVLSERELQSRLDIYLEQYCKTVKVEAALTLEMARTLIFPAVIRYQNELASTCTNLKLLGYEFDTDTLDKITDLVKSLQDSLVGLEKALDHHGADSLESEARHFCEEVLPAMLEVRKYADEMEGWVADDLWPLPTYQEMLFIK
jgi:glutamine synthetase